MYKTKLSYLWEKTCIFSEISRVNLWENMDILIYEAYKVVNLQNKNMDILWDLSGTFTRKKVADLWEKKRTEASVTLDDITKDKTWMEFKFY